MFFFRYFIALKLFSFEQLVDHDLVCSEAFGTEKAADGQRWCLAGSNTESVVLTGYQHRRPTAVASLNWILHKHRHGYAWELVNAGAGKDFGGEALARYLAMFGIRYYVTLQAYFRWVSSWDIFVFKINLHRMTEWILCFINLVKEVDLYLRVSYFNRICLAWVSQMSSIRSIPNGIWSKFASLKNSKKTWISLFVFAN